MGHGKVRKTNTDMLHRQTNTYIEREREREAPHVAKVENLLLVDLWKPRDTVDPVLVDRKGVGGL